MGSKYLVKQLQSDKRIVFPHHANVEAVRRGIEDHLVLLPVACSDSTH